METRNIELGVVPEVEKKGKLVSDAAVARRLLKDGYRVIDIKPKRGHERETIFVFANEGDFLSKMIQYMNERKEKLNRTT